MASTSLKERITLVTAIAAILLVAFARCEPDPPGPVEGSADAPPDLPAGDPEALTVEPLEEKDAQEKETPKKDSQEPTAEPWVQLLPLDPNLVPVQPDRERVHHHVLFGDIDNPHADEDMVIKPPGNRTWPLPVLPRVK